MISIILQRASEYAQALNLSGNYALKTIPVVIELRTDGTLAGILEQEGKILAPLGSSRSSNIAPNYFYDSPEYVFGVLRDDKTALRHASFTELTRRVTEETRDPGAIAVHEFLRVGEMPDHPILKEPDTNVTFKLVGDSGLIYDRPALRQHFVQSRRVDAKESVCRIGGDAAPVARLHPPIVGLPGSKGSKLIAFNKPVFEFEGRSQGDNFEMSCDAVDGYVAAFNHMLTRTGDGGRRMSSVSVGNDVVALLFTSDGQRLDPILDVLDAGKDTTYEKLTLAWEELSDLSENGQVCNVLVLKAYQTRVIVYDAFEITISTLVKNLQRFHHEMPGPATLSKRLFWLGEELHRETLGRLIFVSVVTGKPYPTALLKRSVPTPWRMAAMARSSNQEMNMALNKLHPNPTYQRGALVRCIEELQYDALGVRNLSNQVGNALRNPERGFAKLRTKAHVYLTKTVALKRSGWEATRRYREVEEAISGSPCPKKFTASEENLFWEGYEAQAADFRRVSAERRAKKDAERAAKVLDDATVE